MEDKDLLARINELVDEERTLRRQHLGHGLADPDLGRLTALEEQLDQCWDLLRQRRAKEEFGEDPGTAKTRPAGQVETYLQ
jgi:hypothetical protein